MEAGTKLPRSLDPSCTCSHETQKERGDRNVPTGMLWGRVGEYFYINPEDLSLMLARLGARKCNYMA